MMPLYFSCLNVLRVAIAIAIRGCEVIFRVEILRLDILRVGVFCVVRLNYIGIKT